MKKIIRLTESDLVKLVKRVISEQESLSYDGEMKNIKTLHPQLLNKTVQLYNVPNYSPNNPRQMGPKVKLNTLTYVASYKNVVNMKVDDLSGGEIVELNFGCDHPDRLVFASESGGGTFYNKELINLLKSVVCKNI
jgi:hypothetical protein